MPAVLFSFAENSYFRVLAAEKNPNQAERAKELPKLYEETTQRFQKVIEKYSEFPKINLARYSLGLAYSPPRQFSRTQKVLNEIPGPERTGDLKLTSFLIADCLLRQVPATVWDDPRSRSAKWKNSSSQPPSSSRRLSTPSLKIPTYLTRS